MGNLRQVEVHRFNLGAALAGLTRDWRDFGAAGDAVQREENVQILHADRNGRWAELADGPKAGTVSTSINVRIGRRVPWALSTCVSFHIMDPVGSKRTIFIFRALQGRLRSAPGSAERSKLRSYVRVWRRGRRLKESWAGWLS